MTLSYELSSRDHAADSIECLRVLRDAMAAAPTVFVPAMRDRFERLATFEARGRSRLVAHANGAVQAFIDWQGNEIQWLFVSPSVWRQGVGHALISAVAKKVWGSGLRVLCFEHNAPAIDFYRSVGFEIVARQVEGSFAGMRVLNVRLERRIVSPDAIETN
jgi:GNAT superfamily N-acetyltransferase